MLGGRSGRTVACVGAVCSIMWGGGGAGGIAPSPWLLDVTCRVRVAAIGDPGRLFDACGLLPGPSVDAGVAMGRIRLGDTVSVMA